MVQLPLSLDLGCLCATRVPDPARESFGGFLIQWLHRCTWMRLQTSRDGLSARPNRGNARKSAGAPQPT